MPESVLHYHDQTLLPCSSIVGPNYQKQVVNSIDLGKNDKDLHLWNNYQILGKGRNAHRDTWQSVERKLEHRCTAHDLEVDPQRGGGTGTQEPVHGDPRQDCVWLGCHASP